MEDDCCDAMRPPPPPKKIVFRRFARSSTGQFVTTTDQILDTDMDAESIRRRFGWTTIASTPQPYIFRRGEKFCSTRIFESSIINGKYNTKVQENVYKFCTQATIRTHTITAHEAALLNEINTVHCESQYGLAKFTARDTIFRLFDANHFARFVMICGQLAKGIMPANQRKNFGLIHIDKTGVVPYVVAEDRVSYVPVCFFSDDHKLLRSHKTILGGWNLPYLKLAALIVNVGMDFLTGTTCMAVDFNVVMACFPVGTTFEQYWPTQEDVSRLICNTKVDLAWLRVVPYVEHLITDDNAGGNDNVERDPLEIQPADFQLVSIRQWQSAMHPAPPPLQSIDLPCDSAIFITKPEKPCKK